MRSSSGWVSAALFLVALLNLALVYRLSWTASVDPTRLPPGALARFPLRRRVYVLALLGAVLALVGTASHVMARGVFEAGDWISVYGAVAAGVLLLLAMVGHIIASA